MRHSQCGRSTRRLHNFTAYGLKIMGYRSASAENLSLRMGIATACSLGTCFFLSERQARAGASTGRATRSIGGPMAAPSSASSRSARAARFLLLSPSRCCALDSCRQWLAGRTAV